MGKADVQPNAYDRGGISYSMPIEYQDIIHVFMNICTAP